MEVGPGSEPKAGHLEVGHLVLDLTLDVGVRREWLSAIPQATRDLAQFDAAHHEEFKRYEMLKEHERRRYLESLGEEQRKEAERKLEEQQRRHREHPKVNVPVRTIIRIHLPRCSPATPLCLIP